MFERFSDLSRRTVVMAQQQSRELGHNYIGIEHLLLGLAAQDSGPAREALDSCGVHLQPLQEAVRAAVPPSEKRPAGHSPFTDRAKKALEASLRHSIARGDNGIGTEHILLGVIDQLVEGSFLVTILAELGTTPAALGDAVRAAADTKDAPGAPTGSATDGRTPGLQAAEELATTLAEGMPVGTHHLLAAFLAQPGSAAAQILERGRFDASDLSDAPAKWDVTGTTDDTPSGQARRSIKMTVADDNVSVTITDPSLVAWIHKLQGGESGEAGDAAESIVGLVADALAPLFRESRRPPDDTTTRHITIPGGLGPDEIMADLRAKARAAGLDQATVEKLKARLRDVIGKDPDREVETDADDPEEEPPAGS